jgi:hypothetical protein
MLRHHTAAAPPRARSRQLARRPYATSGRHSPPRAETES